MNVYGAGKDVAPLDLKGLDDCDRVLAILPGGDPGTIFEVGYAVCKKLPVSYSMVFTTTTFTRPTFSSF